jgi:hypothetical protein
VITRSYKTIIRLVLVGLIYASEEMSLARFKSDEDYQIVGVRLL